MRRPIFVLGLLSILLFSLTRCDSQAAQAPAASAAPSITPAAAGQIPATASTSPAPVPGTPADATARATATATATARPIATARQSAPASPTPSGMTITADGQSLVLSNMTYYWSMSIPRDWLTSGNNGYEFDAYQPDKLANVHLLAQTWLTKDRKPNAQAYVDYWKQYKYGNAFPLLAEGALVGQSELSRDKFGGPYLRYEFDDGKRGLRYVQVYASGGGPSSIVATVWAKSADYPALKSLLDAIINSVSLLK